MEEGAARGRGQQTQAPLERTLYDMLEAQFRSLLFIGLKRKVA